jgi:hypothetical protein
MTFLLRAALSADPAELSKLFRPELSPGVNAEVDTGLGE